MKLKLIGALVGVVIASSFALTVFAGNGNGQQRILFGHVTAGSNIVKIDTTSGVGTAVAPTGFPSSASGMATARGLVEGPLAFYAQGSMFALLTDASGDWVVVVETATGAATRIVKTSRAIGARGIAFGADGVTLFVIEGDSALSTINTTTGDVTAIGNVSDGNQLFSAFSLEWDPGTGSFYAITTAAGPSPQSLISIDPVTASAAIVGTAGSLLIDACALARSPDGDWFTVANGQLHTVDVTVGTANAVPDSSGLGDVCGLAFAQDRSLTIASKITICHQAGTPAEQTKEVPQFAVGAHAAHGDTHGACPRPLGSVQVDADGIDVGRCFGGDRCIEFTVTCPGVAAVQGSLRVTGPAAPLGTVILTTGGTGVGFFGNTQSQPANLIPDFLDDLRLAPPQGLGYQIVEVGWGVGVYPNLGNGVWEGPGTTTSLACRPATVIDWIHGNLHLGGLFIGQGNSGGSAQFAFALAYYGQSDLDLANLSGGPPPCPISTAGVINFAEQALCVVGGALFDASREPLLFGAPRLAYPNTTVRFFIGDAEPDAYIVDTATLFHSLISTAKAYQTVANTGHQVAQTDEGLTALLDSITIGP